MTSKLTKSQKRAAFAKLPPAIICKPLRFIGDNTACTMKEDPITKLPVRVPSAEYQRARKAADRGNGALVKGIAREVASAI